MKEKYNFEFPFTNNYGPLRAILHLPQVNCVSIKGATVRHCHSKWTWWISKVQNNFEAFFHKRCLFCHTWPKLLKSWVHRKQRKNSSWHLHASIQHLERIKLIDHVPDQNYSQHFTSSIQPFPRTHTWLIMKFILYLTLKINLLYTC